MKVHDIAYYNYETSLHVSCKARVCMHRIHRIEDEIKNRQSDEEEIYFPLPILSKTVIAHLFSRVYIPRPIADLT
jgi:hypothetical protein